MMGHFLLRKEYAGGFNTIAYAVYSYAKEQNSDRSGTFIGSGILFIDKIAEESIVVDQLNEFQENLISKNVQNDVGMERKRCTIHFRYSPS